MIATNHEELFAWRLSAQLRDQIIVAIDRGRAARDFQVAEPNKGFSSVGAAQSL
jgi:hypothetical protein